MLADCYIETDGGEVDEAALGEVISYLQALPGTVGYVTETFSRRARYFQEVNARRIDAIRDAIEAGGPDTPGGRSCSPPCCGRRSGGLDDRAADGVSQRLVPPFLPAAPDSRSRSCWAGAGEPGAVTPRGSGAGLPDVDLAYLDPPYNQHRYVGNYHVWETLVAWDSPDHYGVACKRMDLRDKRQQERLQPPAPGTRSHGPTWCGRSAPRWW